MATPRIAAIGDSLVQGFQSLAIWNTEWSFPAIIARSLGLSVPGEFRVPSFGRYGLPLNLETMLFDAEAVFPERLGWFEKRVRLYRHIEKYFDDNEDYYERGPGRYPPLGGSSVFRGVFHNLAVWGFSVSDSLHVTPDLGKAAIEKDEGYVEDDFFSLPSAPIYRTAQRVLNPKNEPARNGETQVLALERLIDADGPLDALIVWLGSNDALRTVIDLEVKPMPDGVASRDNPLGLERWNLTSEEVFRADFVELSKRIQDVLAARSPQTKVFVGTVPDVTIPPVLRGQGARDGKFYEYYTRFFVPPNPPVSFVYSKLTRKEASTVHERINTFNAVIRQRAGELHWHVVETAKLLDDLAVRRNGAEGSPERPLRAYCENRGRPNHPLLRLRPIPSILMYQTDQNGKRTAGGLMSLDGVHPTTIGYGLVAELFLESMQRAGVAQADPQNVPWDSIIENDWLIQRPPRLWSAFTELTEQYAALWDALLPLMT